jgi:cytochrome d ubiquinol oxidase subunit II
MSLDLPVIWTMVIAVAVFAYVVMDGFDLGVGILFISVRGRAERDAMVNSIAPVWDGNETWLVLGGGGLFAVFPLAYATLLPALYMPLIVMLLGLVFRGVAFAMRFRARNDREQIKWDRSFQWGSVVAAFCQGLSLGAVVQGVKVSGRVYSGGWWDWLTPFTLLTGLALVAGYGLLGACWLVWKMEGDLQDRFRRSAARLTWVMLGFIGAVSIYMLTLSPAFRIRWLVLPTAAGSVLVPALILFLANTLLMALKRRNDFRPFLCALGFFGLSYIGLWISLWPMMVPPHITLWQAAAPASTQAFLLVGAAVLVPVILIYTSFVYWLFRGKVKAGTGYHSP